MPACTQLFKKGLVGACLRPRERFFSAPQNHGANQRLESLFSLEEILIESRLMLWVPKKPHKVQSAQRDVVVVALGLTGVRGCVHRDIAP